MMVIESNLCREEQRSNQIGNAFMKNESLAYFFALSAFCSVPVTIMASIIDEQKENDCLGLSRNHPDQFYYLKKEVNGVTFHMNNNHE